MLVSRAPELEQGDFETRALVFISQQDEKIQPALEGVLKLCRPEKEDVGKLTEAIRELAKGGGKGGSLLAAFDLHSLNATSARQFAGRKLTVLCECLLNYTMEMSEMLTEERCDLLRSIVETRSCQRVAQRFKDSTAPLTDANEHWRRELDDWRALLAPFSWKNSRAPVMSQVLLAADLCEPLTKHVQLVRSFEYLRCLGGGLIDEEMQGIIQKLQLHGEEFSCWKASEVSEEVLTAYRKSVLPAIPRTQVADMLPKEVMEAEATAKARGALRSAAEAMGFLPSALMGKIPTPVLGQLAWRLLSLVEQEGKVQLDSDLQKLCHNMAETAQMCKDNISEAPLQLCLNFLLRVGKEYLTRATPKRAAGTHLNFELLAGGSPSMQLLRNLETHPEAQRLLGNMALSELLHVASLIREAHGMVHGDSVPIFHAGLEHWLARLKVDPTLHPADMSELSAALDDFLKQNCSARIAGQEEALPSCIARVLQRLAGQPHLDRQESALCLAPVGRQVERRRPESGQQKVVACFGAIPDGAATSVVVRCIPIGLNKSRGNASTGAMVGRDEYEVREVGLRSGGMYRLVTDMFSGQGGSLLDTLEDATMMYYQWVPPSEVREDSQMLQQILVTATHVRLRLPTKSKGDVAEELLIDLQTSQVTGHSSWYQVLPSKSRDSADALGGFRRLALGIGPGLRLPLPQNLFASSGIVETAEVLASLLAIWFSQRHSLEDVCEAIRQQPSLVYFTSVGLLERFDELGGIIIQALKKHWSEVLQMDQSLTHGQISEVKEILLDLLLAGPNDRLAAVLPATHLNDFCSLVKDTKFSLELLAVERFCFEAALERIAAFQQSTLTFILVEITGQISALQLSELIRTASGSIRLVFSWYPGLLPKLALTLSLGNVLLPNSLEADLGSRSAPTPYRDTFALGQATLACKMMKPAELSPLDGLDIVLQRDRSRADSSHRIDWARNLVESQNFLREAHAWACREEEWRRDVRQRAMLLLLVASDEALIQQKYEQMDGVQCFRLNHAERQVLAPVEALLDRLAHHGEATTSSKIPIIVLLGVGFITPSKLEDLVARAYVCGVRVILVAPEPLAFLRCIRVTTRLGTEYLQATILHVRSTLDSETPSLRDTQSHSFMRALQLVLGQVLPSSPPNALLLAIKAQDPAACGTALAALPAPAGRQILRADVAADLCAGIFHSLSDESVEVVRVFDARSLSYATGCLVASFVARADSMELDHKVWDLSFTDFRACLPVCRFLDQVSVLESWCRYLDFVGFQAETLTAHRPQGHWFWPSQSPELCFLSQWDFENNAHSTGIEDLLEQASARLQSPESGEVPAAAYWGSGPTHQSEDPEEVLERQCLQNRELDWSAFSESWRTALDIKPSLFLQLAGLGVDTLRLFLCLPPARAIELGLTYLLDATPMSGSLASEVTRKLLRDLDCVENLLAAAASGGDHSELSSRVAAVKWLLLTVLPESFQSRSMQMTEASIQDLVRSNVMLCPRGRSDLLMRVASMLISLDGNDVLNSQHEIKRFLLETDLPLQRLLSRTSKVGRAVVSLLFCPDHAEQIKRKEVGVVLASSFKELLGYDVLTWQMGSGGEGHRLTAAAHAAVLEYAPNLQVVETLLRGPLITAISKQMTLEGAHAAEGFLCEVLENVPSSDTMVLTILTILSGEDEGVRRS